MKKYLEKINITIKYEKYLKIINNNARDLNYDLEKLFALFRIENENILCLNKAFDLISLIKSIERVYEKEFLARKINFRLNYSGLYKRDCYLNSEAVEYMLRCVMDIFLRFSNFGRCSFNIGHPPVDFLDSREFSANNSKDSEKYVLFEAKIADLIFAQDEIDNIFDPYYKGKIKRPIGLKATLSLLKTYSNIFGGEFWVYSKQNFGTIFTFVLPLR